MYARQNTDSRTSRGFRIPGNYSGNAFSSETEEIYPAKEDNNSTDTIENIQAEPSDKSAQNDAMSDTNAVAAGISRLFGKSSASGGIGFEELLILGVIFLISQNETKDDLAFLLLLLLFIK